MCPIVWPGLCDGGDAATPASLPASYCVTLRPIASNTRRAFFKVVFKTGVTRGLAHLAIVHPELPFHGRHHDFGIRIVRLVVRIQQTVDVIAVEMRNDDDVDVRRIDARSSEVSLKLPQRTLALRIGRRSEAVSITTSLEPAFTTTGVYGCVALSAGRWFAANCALTSSFEAFKT